jgi:hypothetical protein
MRGPPISALAFFALPLIAATGLAVAACRYAFDAEARVQAARDGFVSARARAAADPASLADALLVKGATPGLQAAAFQALILSKTSEAGIETERIEAKEPDDAGSLVRLHAHGSLVGPEDHMMHALIAIEAASPLIFIDRVALAGDGEDNGTLHAEVDLSAYAAREGP